MEELENLSNAELIQVVINTLQVMNIPSTYDNVNKMTGIYNTLFRVRDSLAKEEQKDGAEDHAG